MLRPVFHSRLHRAATALRRIVVALVLLSVALLQSSPASAQVDTPAARDGRAALRQVRQTYGSLPGWVSIARQLNLDDVKQELSAGDHAQSAVFASALAQLRKGSVPQFREPAFQRLATALDTRIKELSPIPEEQWPDACRQQAKNYSPVSAQALKTAQTTLKQRLDDLEQHTSLRQPGDSWRKFLFWAETQALTTSKPPEPAMLDRLETRWENALNAWESFEYAEAALAIRSYIRLLRANQTGETQEQHAAAWNQFADLLEPRAANPTADSAKIAQALNQRERLNQASALTASIRRELSRPNIIVRVRPEWLRAQLAQKLNEPFQISGVYGGASTTGSGKLVGATRLEPLPSNSVGQLRLRLDATTTSLTTGYSEGVRVDSRATTKIAGVKPFTLDARGLTPQPALANATTNIVYDNISAGGRGRRRSEAVRQTNARRPGAEAQSSASAQRTTIARLDAEGKKLAANFNRWYFHRFREPILFADRPCPEVHVKNSDESFVWECRLEGPSSFAASAPPPAFNAEADIVVSCAASALEDLSLVAFGGKKMTRDQLTRSLDEFLGESPRSGPAAQDFKLTFADHACDSQLVDGQLRNRFYISSFESGDTKYPAMTIDVSYTVHERDDGLALVRQGPLRVTPVAQDAADEPPMTGRQQTLRTVVQRTLGKVMAKELFWPRLKLPGSTDENARFRVRQVSAHSGWLQLALSPE